MFRRGYTKEDPFELVASLSCYILSYSVRRQGYFILAQSGGIKYKRTHKCPLRLMIAMADALRPNAARHQQRVVRRRGEPALGVFVHGKVPRRNIFVVDNTYPTYPSVLNGISAPIQAVASWMADDVLPRYPEAGNYINSRLVEDDELRTEALTQLVEPREDPVTEDTVENICDMLMAAWATLPAHDVHVDKMTVAGLVMQPTTKAISGAVNVQPSHGDTCGSKEEMISAAAVTAMANTDAINCVGSPKAEVIKRNKKVRQIIAEPMPLYLKSSFFFGSIVRSHGRIVDGDCNGMSKVNGIFLKWLLSIYYDERRFEPDLEWEAFLDLLEETGLDEDDKVAWEKTTNRACTLAAVMYLASICTPHPDDKHHMAQVLAHQLAPIVKYNGHICYVAPYKVASGTLFTLYLNNVRHIMGTRWVAAYVQKHGMRWGSPDCKCSACLAVGADGTPCTPRELSRVVGGAHLGDDRIRMGHKADIVARLVDHVLGTETVAENKPAFDGAEFLRTRLRRNRGGNISVYRDASRVFAKLAHGDAARNKHRLAAAIQCASYELGDNKPAHEVLKKLWNRLGICEDDAVAIHNEQHRGVYDGVLEGDPLAPPSWDEVMLKTCLMDRPAIEAHIAHSTAIGY